MFRTSVLCLSILSLAALAENVTATYVSRQASTGVAIHARVVDDETGNPIESFNVESGRAAGKDPAMIVWGGMSWSVPSSYTIVNGKPILSKNPGGEFNFGFDVGDGRTRQGGWLRIVADGYEPRPITDQPLDPSDAGKTIEPLVRLKRGRPLFGRVLDHAGQPAARARLFLIRPSGKLIQIVDDVIGVGHDTGLLDPGVTRAVADAQGRFRLTGLGDATEIGVTTESIHFWRVAIPPAGEQPTIRLPEPATIRIPYAIDGDEAEAAFQLHLGDPEGPNHRLSVSRTVKVPNRKVVVVSDATPGDYTLWRMKTVTHADYHQSVGCEMRTISVGSGRTFIADFTRERGSPIVGRVSGPEGDKARMIFVGIEPKLADGVVRLRGFGHDVMEIVPCGDDGRFQTARIPPGEYVVHAVGYRTGPRYGPFASMESSDFIGSTPVFVPLDGNAPEVQIKLAVPPQAN